MGFDAHVLKVMISSPGDTTDEVQAVKDALYGWNGSRSENAETVLLPRFWKTDAVPTLSSSGGQSVINSQLLDDADIVIVLFDSRLGQATDTAVSGTAEEIERADGAGKPVHVWFSDEPIDRHTDLKELGRLKKFRDELEDKGLLGVYADLNDLAYKVRDAVESDISKMGLGTPSVKRKGEHAKPRAKIRSWREQDGIDRRSGAAKFKTRNRLVLENLSDTVTAEGLTVDLGELESWVRRPTTEPFDLPPDSPLEWVALLVGDIPPQLTVTFRWTEDGNEHSFDQPLTI
ncbi:MULTISPECIES: hypothetical protein [Tsukamurella]|uniref:DUF4062 domain-containing protein n=3 Tax=Tsukamurella TaxID=2060 RepID=A0A3P8LCR8_TSUPA|nr:MULTISPECIES: hypothetical protein [Tsukamurella]NMD57598.1 DUF4062 domain-containing protein [Tsukamurella columbiensis]TWS29002.1 hypothetical protein FK530_09260 [Tsukamurella conjunctivitidis]UEA84789.1 hypothetical protein LK411_08215 [Tsukamurella paurometabola]VDR37372.1 Uncharacterised protein [Tsukamurella paurometabola]